MRNNKVQLLVISALLCAIGIIIPVFSPVKVIMEPASFTLGSHIAIFIAMFIAPSVAVGVSLGTAIGFFLGGFPIVIVLRALTHVVFALAGALVLYKMPGVLKNVYQTALFALCIGVIHAVCEVGIVTPFYFGSDMSQAYYAKGYVTSVILLVGVGTVVHSLVDFGISYVIWRPLKASRLLKRAV